MGCTFIPWGVLIFADRQLLWTIYTKSRRISHMVQVHEDSVAIINRIGVAQSKTRGCKTGDWVRVHCQDIMKAQANVIVGGQR